MGGGATATCARDHQYNGKLFVYIRGWRWGEGSGEARIKLRGAHSVIILPPTSNPSLFMLVEIGPEGGRRHNSPLTTLPPPKGSRPKAPLGGEGNV
jgi:hypothetical protein